MGIQIPSGAYVIRSKERKSVVQIQDAAFSSWSWVGVSQQDENNYRDQQIWWIEPLPDSVGYSDEVVCSIMNICSGKALGLRNCNGEEAKLKLDTHKATYVTASPANGAPWQRWKVKGTLDSDGQTYYTLMNVDNGYVLDIGPDKKNWCLNQKPDSGRAEQCWEFVLPKVAFPCGWIHLQNSKTGALLSHEYLSTPPILVDPPSVVQPSQYRDGWDTQWTLINVGSYAPKSSCTTGPNTWCIRNRLTKAFLSNTPKLGITAWESNLLYAAEGGSFKDGIDIAEYTWKLDLDLGPERYWNITNYSTSCKLAQVLKSGARGFGVCADEKYNRNTSWNLRPPNEVRLRAANQFTDPPPY